MTLRLRQIAVAVHDLDAACADAEELFDVRLPYRDAGVARYGLRNAVYRLGDTFLELLSPATDGTTVGRLLAKRGGDCGYMVILQTDDIDDARDRIAGTGTRIVDQVDREGAGFTHLHPSDVGGTLLSVDYMAEWHEWEWGGPPLQDDTIPNARIIAAEMHGPDPGKIAKRWEALLGVSCSHEANGPTISLDEGDLRFARGTKIQEGLAGFDLRSSHGERMQQRALRRNCLRDDGSIGIWGMTVHLVGDSQP
jgi:hypothetical protein